MASKQSDRLGYAAIPFFLMHLACVAVIWTPPTMAAILTGIGLYVLRMFAITAGYHRYFAHRTYKTGRVFQFMLAWVGSSAAQKGVLWWAGHHRNHHKYSDTPLDIHSPKQRGFWFSHVGWFLVSTYDETPVEKIGDFNKYPELRWLNRWHLLPPALLGVGIWLALGWSGFLWGFLVSTVLLWHGTFTINSLSHVFGRRRFATTDTSRNNWLLAIVTLGEGWHNNHHYFQSSVNQGFFWWEYDISYYILRGLRTIGLVSDFKYPPASVLAKNRVVRTATVEDRWAAPGGAVSGYRSLGVSE